MLRLGALLRRDRVQRLPRARRHNEPWSGTIAERADANLQEC
jgi:hypothetical protein